MFEAVDELLFQVAEVLLAGFGEEFGEVVERVGEFHGRLWGEGGGAYWPGCLAAFPGACFAPVDAVAYLTAGVPAVVA